MVTAYFKFKGDHELHGKLTESAIQVSNWLREYSRDDVTRLELHVASSMIAALRLAGHLHHTIISDFKSNDSFTIVDYLKSHLDNHVAHYKNLSMIKPGHIAYIYQAVSALCHDTENFYGRNLTQALHEGFSSMKQDHLRRQNYFEYSVVALAVCQSFGRQIQSKLASNILVEIKKHSSTETCSRIPDTAAMEVMALSCLRRNIENTKVELLQDIDAVIQQHLRKIGDRLRKHEDGLWNAQSKGLLVQVGIVCCCWFALFVVVYFTYQLLLLFDVVVVIVAVVIVICCCFCWLLLLLLFVVVFVIVTAVVFVVVVEEIFIG